MVLCLDEMIKEGLYPSDCEYTHELAWNVIKFTLLIKDSTIQVAVEMHQGSNFNTPNFPDGKVWMDMIGKSGIKPQTP